MTETNEGYEIRALAPLEGRSISLQEFQQEVADAQGKAKILAAIVASKKLYIMISGRKYLRVEAWQTIGKGYGYRGDTAWTRPLPNGGWEARMTVLDRDGNIVGHAEAECGSEGDGEWVSRSSFSQRSMAQTRALAKAFRMLLAWVVVLAGYEPTPAEEMVANTAQPMKTQPMTTQPRKSEGSIPAQAAPADQILAYRDRLGWDSGTLRAWLESEGLVQPGAKVQKADYPKVLQALKDLAAHEGALILITEAMGAMPKT